MPFLAPFIAGLAAALAGTAPMVLVGGFSSAFAAGITVGTFLTSTLGTLLITGITIGAGLLLRPRPPAVKPSDTQLNLRQVVPNRIKYFGEVLVGGPYAFWAAKGGYFTVIILTGQGESAEIVQRYLNAIPVSFDSQGDVQEDPFWSRGTPRVRVENHLGTDDQVASPLMLTEWGTAIDGATPIWTTDHRLRGITYAVMRCESVRAEAIIEVYPGGTVPAYTEHRRTQKVYDPRDEDQSLEDPSTYMYSDNGALVLAYFLTDPDGFGLPPEGLAWELLGAEADICDQIILDRDGNPVKRYRLWGGYALNEDRGQTVSNMLGAMDAVLFTLPDGRVTFSVGRWEEPTVEITPEHILEVDARRFPTPTNESNEVHIIYTEPLFRFKEAESSGWRDEANFAERGELSVPTPQLVYIPHNNQASRIAKRIVRVLLAEWAINLRIDLTGLRLYGKRFAKLTFPEYGLAGAYFEVQSFKRAEDGLSVQVSLTSTGPTDFDFDSATEEPPPPKVPNETGEESLVELPTGIAVTIVIVRIANASGPTIQVTWNPPPSENVYHRVQYRLSTDPIAESSYVSMVVNEDANKATSVIVDEGQTYAVRYQAYLPSGDESPWSDEVLIDAISDPTAPGPVTEFEITSPSAGKVALSWKDPNSQNFRNARIYRADDPGDFGSAVDISGEVYGAPQQEVTAADLIYEGGTFDYWAVSENWGGIQSAPAPSTPVSIVVSPFDDDTLALLGTAAFTSAPPSYTDALLYDTLIKGMKNASIWALFDSLQIYAAHGAQCALVDVRVPSRVAVLGTNAGDGSVPPTFIANKGYQGTGTGHIHMGLTLAAGSNFQQDNAGFGVWSLTPDQSASNTDYDMGIRPTASGPKELLAIRRLSDATMITVNDNTAFTYTNTDGSGFYNVLRSGASARRLRKNKATVASDTVASIGNNIGSEFWVLTANNIGTRSSRLLSAAWVSANLTDTQSDAFYDLLKAFLDAKGAT